MRRWAREDRREEGKLVLEQGMSGGEEGKPGRAGGNTGRRITKTCP